MENEQRLQPEDYERLIQAQLRYSLREQAIKDAGIENTGVEEFIRADMEYERRQVFVALGIEKIDELDQLI